MASKRRIRRKIYRKTERTCQAKRAYETQTDAVASLISYPDRDKNLHTYQCPVCQKFHIGHSYKLKRRIR